MSSGHQWRKENPERAKAARLAHYAKNRDKILEARRADKEKNTIRNKEWRKANPEKCAAIYRRKNLRDKYGLTLEMWEEMAEAQDHKCAICGTHRDELKNNLAVDHNHTTGEVRGLLCYACNRGIGLLKDSAEVLNKAAAYLTRQKVK